MPTTSGWEAEFDELVSLAGEARQARLEALARQDPARARFLTALLAADTESTRSLDGPLFENAPRLVAAAFGAEAEEAPVPRDRTGEIVGRYRLLRLLGRGGMAEVWLAERADGELDYRVALKLVRPELDSEEIHGRFLRERQILARLRHPGIASFLDGGRSARGEPYFVLEHIDGTPILDWCKANQASIEKRIRLLLAVCQAVDHAHRSLVIHRDLKPSNILVDSSGQPKLLDFGIAKLLSFDSGEADPEALTRLHTVAMTPSYAAPEQIRGEPVTTAIDVYALGVLLYELLTGELPHRRRERALDALARQVEDETLERPSDRLRRRLGETLPATSARKRASRLEGDLDTIVAKAMHRDSARRYPSAAALGEDLARHLDGRPVRARPDSLAYRASRFVTRHRLAVAAAALVLVSLVSGLALALWQGAIARTEARRAAKAREFLASIFETADPERANGEMLTARQLLTAGTVRIERELASEPTLLAEMLDLLAGIHRKLGLLAEARPLAERALSLRREAYGEESLEAARSRFTLGWICVDQGELKLARELLERAIADFERLQGPDSLFAADAREPLAQAVFSFDGPAATLPIVERRIATYRRSSTVDPAKLAVALNDLGVVLGELNRDDEAEVAYRSSVAQLAAHLPANDPRHLTPTNNLIRLLLQKDRLDDAEPPILRAIELARETLGDNHTVTAYSLVNLVFLRQQQERFAEAETAAREVLAIAAAKDPYLTAEGHAMLAFLLLLSKRPADALAEADIAIESLGGIVGPNHPQLWNARGTRARALLQLGERRRGLRELEEVVAAAESLGGAGASNLISILPSLAEERRRDGRVAEAAALDARAQELQREREP